jgi:hypothetical protein
LVDCWLLKDSAEWSWLEVRLRHRQEDNIKMDLRVIKTELTCDKILDSDDGDDYLAG